MVAFHDGHEHDGEVCPQCRFKATLAEHLKWAAVHSELNWHELTAEISLTMCEALAALTATRAGEHTVLVSQADAADRAAGLIVRLGSIIDTMAAVFMDEDEDEAR